jgi:hypothetical protein
LSATLPAGRFALDTHSGRAYWIGNAAEIRAVMTGI